MSPLRFLAIVAATMLVLAFATWALGPVAAGETIDWNVRTIATIRATTEPGAVARMELPSTSRRRIRVRVLEFNLFMQDIYTHNADNYRDNWHDHLRRTGACA